MPDRWLVWFRPELEQTVDWGGDPRNKQLASARGRPRSGSPRASRSTSGARSCAGAACRGTTTTPTRPRSLRGHLNALLLKRSHDQIQVAESLQRSVLAERAPALEGLDVAVRYTSAASYQLGGDWWDCLVLDDDRVAFVIGDVAGHGVDAVAAMTQVRAALRAYLLAGDGRRHRARPARQLRGAPRRRQDRLGAGGRRGPDDAAPRGGQRRAPAAAAAGPSRPRELQPGRATGARARRRPRASRSPSRCRPAPRW